MKRNRGALALLAATLVLMSVGFTRGARARGAASASGEHFAAGRVQVYVLNVGMGQSVLVISPTGKAALIDAGAGEAGSRVVSELRRRGVQKLELVVATQTGADYVGGLRRVMGSSDLVVKSFVDSAQPWKTDAYQQTMAAAQSANVPVVAARRGLFFELGGGVRLDIINPAGDGAWLEPAEGESREGVNSVVVRLLYREFVMLIMSGAGVRTAARMMEARQNIWAPFLLVGNGGSRGSVSEKMLQVIQPRFAIIPAGANNAPATETLELLKGAGAEIYRTDTRGEISIVSDGSSHEIATERKGAR